MRFKSLTKSSTHPTKHKLAPAVSSPRSHSTSYAPSISNKADTQLEHARSDRKISLGSKWSDYYVLLIMAAYVAYLGFNDQLRLYIHPRYIVFTIAMALVALTLVVSNNYFTKKSEHDHTGLIGSLSLGLMLTLAVVFPARTLTSATVTQRLIDNDAVVSTGEVEPLDALFSGSSRGLKIADWARLLQVNKDPAYYANRPAQVSGFVYDADLGNNTVWLARFVLTCCAVDAQPVGVPVQIESWPEIYESDQWLEIEGEFKRVMTADGEQLVLIPTNIKPIEQPSNPYAN